MVGQPKHKVIALAASCRLSNSPTWISWRIWTSWCLACFWRCTLSRGRGQQERLMVAPLTRTRCSHYILVSEGFVGKSSYFRLWQCFYLVKTFGANVWNEGFCWAKMPETTLLNFDTKTFHFDIWKLKTMMLRDFSPAWMPGESQAKPTHFSMEQWRSFTSLMRLTSSTSND